MFQITLNEAKDKLPELIQSAQQGEDIIITADSKPVARLVSISETEPKEKPHPQFGSGKGLILYRKYDKRAVAFMRQVNCHPLAKRRA